MSNQKSPIKLIIVLCTLICIGLIAVITLRFVIPIANGTIAQTESGGVYSASDVDPKVLNLLNNSDERYAYTKLTANEKRAYERLKWGILSFAEKIDLREMRLKEEELKKIYSSLRNDYPEIFWTYNNCNVYYSGKFITDCSPYYLSSGENILTMVDSIVQVRDAFRQRIKGMSDYEICMFFFNYIIDYTDYDTESLNNYKNGKSDEKLENSCGIYGTLLHRKALCEGYAKTYKFLLEASGIECLYVTGVALDEGHAWNVIKLDGNYYAVDVTWCDPQMRGGSKSYAYCMVDDKTLFANHELKMEYDIPSCTGGRYNYYTFNGFELFNYDTGTLQNMFLKAYLSGDDFVEFHCNSKEVLLSFKQAVESGQVFDAFKRIEDYTGKRYQSCNYGLMEDVNVVRVDLK